MAYSQLMQEKIGDYIDFPLESLDMRKYCVGPEKDSPVPVYYDLYGVSNHYGSLHGGHYTAYCKNSVTGQWLDFNDSSCSSASESSIRSSAAYVLFYRRRKDTQPQPEALLSNGGKNNGDEDDEDDQ